jgi:hypothetical protein
MCLKDVITGEALKAEVDKLPEEFPVFKALRGNKTEYAFHNKKEPAMCYNKVYIAGVFPEARMSIKDYKPGFHAFLHVADAERYIGYKEAVRKFWAKREWVTTIGYDQVSHFKCVVLSHIEKRSWSKKNESSRHTKKKQAS